jgi:hypothetical protein
MRPVNRGPWCESGLLAKSENAKAAPVKGPLCSLRRGSGLLEQELGRVLAAVVQLSVNTPQLPFQHFSVFQT